MDHQPLKNRPSYPCALLGRRTCVETDPAASAWATRDTPQNPNVRNTTCDLPEPDPVPQGERPPPSEQQAEPREALPGAAGRTEPPGPALLRDADPGRRE